MEETKRLLRIKKKTMVRCGGCKFVCWVDPKRGRINWREVRTKTKKEEGFSKRKRERDSVEGCALE